MSIKRYDAIAVLGMDGWQGDIRERPGGRCVLLSDHEAQLNEAREAEFVAGWREGLQAARQNEDGSESWQSILRRSRKDMADWLDALQSERDSALAAVETMKAAVISYLDPTLDGDVASLLAALSAASQKKGD